MDITSFAKPADAVPWLFGSCDIRRMAMIAGPSVTRIKPAQ
jgi:hypothetical protein